MTLQFDDVTVKTIYKPRDLYFLKTLFEGLKFWRGLSTGEIWDWASLIAGSKFTVVALFYFVFEGNFPSTSSQGAYTWRGDLTEGFLHYRFGGLYFEGLIHEGAYFRNFTVLSLGVRCCSSSSNAYFSRL